MTGRLVIRFSLTIFPNWIILEQSILDHHVERMPNVYLNRGRVRKAQSGNVVGPLQCKYRECVWRRRRFPFLEKPRKRDTTGLLYFPCSLHEGERFRARCAPKSIFVLVVSFVVQNVLAALPPRPSTGGGLTSRGPRFESCACRSPPAPRGTATQWRRW